MVYAIYFLFQWTDLIIQLVAQGPFFHMEVQAEDTVEVVVTAFHGGKSAVNGSILNVFLRQKGPIQVFGDLKAFFQMELFKEGSEIAGS